MSRVLAILCTATLSIPLFVSSLGVLFALDMNTKVEPYPMWCETGMPPPGFGKYEHIINHS